MSKVASGNTHAMRAGSDFFQADTELLISNSSLTAGFPSFLPIFESIYPTDIAPIFAMNSGFLPIFVADL
jgi:hypothetical protein